MSTFIVFISSVAAFLLGALLVYFYHQKRKLLTITLQANLENLQKNSSELKQTNEQLLREKESLTKELSALKEQEFIRQEGYRKSVDQLNLVYSNLESDRERERIQRKQMEENRLQSQRETWTRHENEVEKKIRLFCQQESIEYIDKEKFPFSGKPDNAIKICGEYIVFDSKSPQGDDLTNFPSYIRREAEGAKKYAKNDLVKKDIYLVVPTNAIHAISETYIHLADYRVHVITSDALKSILIHLKKIEEYEFADKLSPEDREKIVTVIGKMAHGMKRRIQIDYFFANEFISTLTDAENLPSDILTGAQAIERSSKLNPYIEKRAKRIEIETLSKEGQKIAGKIAGQEIHVGQELKQIENIPLHQENQKQSAAITVGRKAP